ncbi:DUF1501 domain-containing protein [Lignipirellula cremea]|uniref:DUF1501 domain-containing protein n=1 Tax=Lignipirellula cremea TaxID=2528010 RepID=A0A518DM95_9BACT|nr:DUF1501 domain-containing protein [Lignipirellula cremea]QDU92959.1 hypothetical protein Pla8534_07320 [Lignipirellula cremea]
MTNSCLDYRLTRRSLLAAGGASILGLQVSDLLALEGSSHASKAEHVILFWNGGGMSHIDTWDPKPGRPTAGEFSPIKTSVPGIEISEIFPKLSKQMQDVALIRSIAGTQGAHERASYQLQTSYLPAGNLKHPGLGSVVASQRKSLGDLPAYISISGMGRGASYLGQQCEAYYVPAPGEKDPYLAFPDGIANVRGNKRLEILARYNQKFAAANRDDRLAATKTSIEDAVHLMRSPALEAFELGKVPYETIERYGDNAFGRGALLAKRLVEKGVRFVQINRGGFDTHSNNFEALTRHGGIMDPALASLIQDLREMGKLDTTLIVMMSEFGRTPRINEDVGRDHWPNVFSCMMAGGGLRGGTVIGSSDEDGAYPDKDPVEVADLHATICHQLGIDGNKEVMTQLRRPMKLVDNGTPIAGLIS